jgi:hypothetical protein
MVYRIRYCEARGPATAEMTLEANSPAEAMVKFQHTRPSSDERQPNGPRITSVAAEGETAETEK